MSKTSKGIGRTSGWRCKGAAQLEQTGMTPFGGCSTTAGPQQHDGQR
ncbi:hypothetical protein SynPROSU1_01523 [Synechococcus sp. PROS-U-1]|nr:hypothetical protein SynPROSU1_01523 [Synechococcus sp. PROS-U-1]